MENRYFKAPPTYPAEREAYITWWRETKEDCVSLGVFSKTGKEKMEYAKELVSYALSAELTALLLEMTTGTLTNYANMKKVRFSGKRGNLRNNILKRIADEERRMNIKLDIQSSSQNVIPSKEAEIKSDEERRVSTHPDVLPSPPQNVKVDKEVRVKSNEEVLQGVLSEYKLAAALIRAEGKNPDATTLASVTNKKTWVVKSFIRRYPDFETREKI